MLAPRIDMLIRGMICQRTNRLTSPKRLVNCRRPNISNNEGISGTNVGENQPKGITSGIWKPGLLTGAISQVQ